MICFIDVPMLMITNVPCVSDHSVLRLVVKVEARGVSLDSYLYFVQLENGGGGVG